MQVTCRNKALTKLSKTCSAPSGSPHHSLSSCCCLVLLPVNVLKQLGASFSQSKPLSPLQTVSVPSLGSHSGSSASSALWFRISTRWSTSGVRPLGPKHTFSFVLENLSILTEGIEADSQWHVRNDVNGVGSSVVTWDRCSGIFNHLVNGETNKKMPLGIEQGV